MAANKNVHPATQALSRELNEWEQYPEDSGWYFYISNGRLTAEKLGDDGDVVATYSADLHFTKNEEN